MVRAGSCDSFLAEVPPAPAPGPAPEVCEMQLLIPKVENNSTVCKDYQTRFKSDTIVMLIFIYDCLTFYHAKKKKKKKCSRL